MQLPGERAQGLVLEQVVAADGDGVDLLAWRSAIRWSGSPDGREVGGRGGERPGCRRAGRHRPPRSRRAASREVVVSWATDAASPTTTIGAARRPGPAAVQRLAHAVAVEDAEDQQRGEEHRDEATRQIDVEQERDGAHRGQEARGHAGHLRVLDRPIPQQRRVIGPAHRQEQQPDGDGQHGQDDIGNLGRPDADGSTAGLVAQGPRHQAGQEHGEHVDGHHQPEQPTLPPAPRRRWGVGRHGGQPEVERGVRRVRGLPGRVGPGRVEARDLIRLTAVGAMSGFDLLEQRSLLRDQRSVQEMDRWRRSVQPSIPSGRDCPRRDHRSKSRYGTGWPTQPALHQPHDSRWGSVTSRVGTGRRTPGQAARISALRGRPVPR